MQDTMEKLDSFIERHGITAEVEVAADNPHMHDAMPGSNHYRVTLKAGDQSMTVPYTMGPALTEEPDAATVLDTLASDSAMLDEFEDGIEMALGLGGSIESSEDVDRANRTYETIQSQAAELREMLSPAEFEKLLYETERL